MWRRVMQGLTGVVSYAVDVWLDPFGHTLVRRVERALLVAILHLSNACRATRLHSVPSAQSHTAELARGFKEVKIQNVVA